MELGFSYIKSITNWVLDVLFPENCLGCHKKGIILCNKCIPTIRSAERETSSGIMAAYDYRDPLIKKAIWNLKYYKRRHLGKKLGEMLYEEFLEEVSDIRTLAKGQSIYIVPVPLSRTRRKMRGYNQAEVIARGFCEYGEKGVFKLQSDIILKKVDTLPQARITNRVTRLRNIHNAFKITNPDLIRGKIIIIIDDVTTTGGTITEIIKLLKSSGAKKVIGFAVAH